MVSPARDLSGDRRPGSGRGLDFERPADECEPLSHAEQAERIFTDIGVVEAAAVVVDRRSDASLAVEITMLTCSAPECLTTFVSASWTTR